MYMVGTDLRLMVFYSIPFAQPPQNFPIASRFSPKNTFLLYFGANTICECEDCISCPYASECKKTPKNRTVGVIKYDRRYRRIVRRGINSVGLEVFLVSISHNLYKLCNKTMKKQNAAYMLLRRFLWG